MNLARVWPSGATPRALRALRKTRPDARGNPQANLGQEFALATQRVNVVANCKRFCAAQNLFWPIFRGYVMSIEMNAFDEELSARLNDDSRAGSLPAIAPVGLAHGSRESRSRAPALLNFSSNDYLGLANDPALKAAAIEAVNKFGAGTGASRLVCGSMHALLINWKDALAAFKVHWRARAGDFRPAAPPPRGAVCALLDSDDA